MQASPETIAMWIERLALAALVLGAVLMLVSGLI